MAIFVFANNAASSFAAPITNVATTFTVQAGDGAKFPNPSAGQQFAIVVNDAATGLNIEIMYCTSRAGDVFTVVRAQEGTVAQSWLAGDLVANMWTSGQAAAMQQSQGLNPARTITASGAFVINTTDAFGGIGLNRTSGLATSSAALPNGATNGQLYSIEDLAGNFNAFPVTISASSGTTIAGLASAVLNVNRQCAQFRLYTDSNLWSFKP